MPSHLLVTGGAGFIGSNFIRFALRADSNTRVTNLDALTYCGNLANLADVANDPALAARYRFVHGDVCDAALVDQLVNECDAIVHFAAESHVDRSIIDALPFVRTNVLGTQTLLDAVRRCSTGATVSAVARGGSHAAPGTADFQIRRRSLAVARPSGLSTGVKRFLHVSTDEVYGSLPLEPRSARFTEDSPMLPNSPYAASKAGADALVRSHVHTYGLDAIITRSSNNFGPFQFPEKIIPLFVTNLIDGKKVPLYGDGLNIRDWLHVEDHCEALLAILDRGHSGETYNIGGNKERSNLELTRAILQIMGRGEEMIEHVADRPGHDRRYALDASKLERELGWRPTRSAWPGVLESTVRWYIDNQSWWRPLQQRAALTA